MTHDTGHFGKFNQAHEDVSRLAREGPIVAARQIYSAIAEAIRSGQRFYVPDATNTLDGKTIDDEIKSLIKLPFDCTVLLSNTLVEEAPGQWVPSWKISIGFDPYGAFNRRVRVFDPSKLGGTRTFLVFSVFRASFAGQKTWLAQAALAAAKFQIGELGYQVAMGDVGDEISNELGVPKDAICSVAQVKDDVVALMNLCAMLSLENVDTSKVEPPSKLSKARQKSGKSPLCDYHVLMIDGERWDKLAVSAGTVGGIRSHLRRGHIRRLDGGTKKVWVRPTFVQGNAPGFIDKDYIVKS